MFSLTQEELPEELPAWPCSLVLFSAAVCCAGVCCLCAASVACTCPHLACHNLLQRLWFVLGVVFNCFNFLRCTCGVGRVHVDGRPLPVSSILDF